MKYAITGVQPPGTKGGAFIHDPKIAGKTQVHARIKLQFLDTKRRQCIVQRSISLTQRATKTEYKALEGLITINDGVKKTSMSTKCAELDVEMSYLLGVSKPILGNVIFCHQEESNWPLSEPKVLKQKFDEIFASTRFVKALDSLKKKKTEILSKIRELDVELKYFAETQARKKEVVKNVDILSYKMKETKKEIQVIDNDLAPLEVKLDKLNSESEKIYQKKSKYDSLISSRAFYEKSINDLKNGIFL